MKQRHGLQNWLEWGGLYCCLVASAEGHKACEFSHWPCDEPSTLSQRTATSNAASLNLAIDILDALADAGPVSIVSEASLSDLNRVVSRRKQESGERESEGVPLNWFRMSIEISGCG